MKRKGKGLIGKLLKDIKTPPYKVDKKGRMFGF